MLTGPRQVGKTTLLKTLGGADRTYVSLDDLLLRDLALSEPKLFLQRFPPPATIDEIQYAPNLLSYIKLTIDAEHRNAAYWLTGSQQFPIMKGVSESLAGRVAVVNLLGLSLRERMGQPDINSPFIPPKTKDLPPPTARQSQDIFPLIHLGCFPYLIANPNTDWSFFYSSYLQTYLQRDVRDLTQVGNLIVFIRFIKACAARTGQLLNIADLARDTDIDQKTAKHWLAVLQTSNLILLLPPYHNNITKRLIKTPKLYFLDTGLAAYLTGWTSAQTLRDGAMAGPFFETFVITEIYKSHFCFSANPPLYFYRDKDGVEIDLIIEMNDTIYPVEIKKSANVSKDWVRQFRTLQRLDQTIGNGAVICLSDVSLPIDEQNVAVAVWDL